VALAIVVKVMRSVDIPNDVGERFSEEGKW
jgi:hypothetical protein